MPAVRSSEGCSGRQLLPELWETWNLSRHAASIPDDALGTREESDLSTSPSRCQELSPGQGNQDMLRALDDLRKGNDHRDADFKVVHTGTHKQGFLLSAKSSSIQNDGGGGAGCIGR